MPIERKYNATRNKIIICFINKIFEVEFFHEVDANYFRISFCETGALGKCWVRLFVKPHHPEPGAMLPPKSLPPLSGGTGLCGERCIGWNCPVWGEMHRVELGCVGKDASGGTRRFFELSGGTDPFPAKARLLRLASRLVRYCCPLGEEEEGREFQT